MPIYSLPSFHCAHDRAGVPQEVLIPPLVFFTGLLDAGLKIVRVFGEHWRGMSLFVAGPRPLFLGERGPPFPPRVFPPSTPRPPPPRGGESTSARAPRSAAGVP